MARAQHEPHSGGSLCLGTSGETGQPQALVLTFPLPHEKSKNTRPPRVRKRALAGHMVEGRREYGGVAVGTRLWLARKSWPDTLTPEEHGQATSFPLPRHLQLKIRVP